MEEGGNKSNDVSDPADFETDEEERLGLEISKSNKKNKDFVSIIIYYLSPVTRTYFHWEHVTCRTPEETSRLLCSLEFDVKRLLSDVALILSNQRRMMPPNSTTRNPMSLTNFPIANLEQFEDLETMLSQSADAMDDLV